MTVDHQISYEFAGKGAKRRQKLQPAEESKRKAKQKPYLQKPEFEKRKVRQNERSEAYRNAIGVKARIRLLVIDHDMGYLDICETMKREGCPVTGVTIGNLRTEMRDIMKLLEREGLLNVDALAKRRRRVKARNRDG